MIKKLSRLLPQYYRGVSLPPLAQFFRSKCRYSDSNNQENFRMGFDRTRAPLRCDAAYTLPENIESALTKNPPGIIHWPCLNIGFRLP